MTNRNDAPFGCPFATPASHAPVYFDRIPPGKAGLNLKITSAREAVDAIPEGDPRFLSEFQPLLSLLAVRFAIDPTLKDIQIIISYLDQAATLAAKRSPQHALVLEEMAVALQKKYTLTRDSTDLDRAAECIRDAIDMIPDQCLMKCEVKNTLMGILREKYLNGGNPNIINEACDLAEEVVRLATPKHPAYAGYLNNLGNVYLKRYFRKKEAADVDKSIKTLRQAVEVMPKGLNGLPLALDNLSHSLMARHDHTGDRADLLEAISKSEEAVEEYDTGDPNYPAHLPEILHSLSAAYSKKVKLDGDVAALSKAIEAAERAGKLMLPTCRYKFRNISILCELYCDMSDVAGNVGLVDKVIERVKEGLASQGCWPRDRSLLQDALSHAFFSKYTLEGQTHRQDLETAISLGKEASFDHTDPKYPRYATNTSLKLSFRACKYKSAPEIHEAISFGSKALQRVPSNHPSKVTILSALGDAAYEQYHLDGSEHSLFIARNYKNQLRLCLSSRIKE